MLGQEVSEPVLASFEMIPGLRRVFVTVMDGNNAIAPLKSRQSGAEAHKAGVLNQLVSRNRSMLDIVKSMEAKRHTENQTTAEPC